MTLMDFAPDKYLKNIYECVYACLPRDFHLMAVDACLSRSPCICPFQNFLGLHGEDV